MTRLLLISLLFFSNIAIAQEFKYIGIVGDVIILKHGESKVFTKIGKKLPNTDLTVADVKRIKTRIKVVLSDGTVLKTHTPEWGPYKGRQVNPELWHDEEVGPNLKEIHKKKAKEAEENEKRMEADRKPAKEEATQTGEQTD